jgi:hypothetical protein
LGVVNFTTSQKACNVNGEMIYKLVPRVKQQMKLIKSNGHVITNIKATTPQQQII